MKKFKVELVSWETIYKLSRTLARKILKSGYKPDIIIGIARGGWVPARNLCDFMEIKDLVSMKIEHWGITATPDGKPKLKFPLNVNLKGKKVLVVDDITDTGEGMELGIEHIKSLKPAEIKTATLHHISHSKFTPDFIAHELSWRWVLYPWCFTEDMINLVKNCLEGKDKIHLEAVREGIEEAYEISVSLDELEEILIEMERRDIAERIKEDPTHWRCKS